MSRVHRGRGVLFIIVLLLLLMQILYIASFFVSELASDIRYITLSSVGAVAFSMVINFLFIRYIEDNNKLFEVEKEEELRANLDHLDRRYFELIEFELAKSAETEMILLEHIGELRRSIGSDLDCYPITAIDEDINRMQSLHYCDEPIVDMVLILKKNKAEQESIPMEIKASVPSDLIISKLDLSSSVSNMLDNAIEAAMSVKEAGGNPYVDVSMALTGGFLVIRTQNPTLIGGMINDIGELHTSKDNRFKAHGYGLKIIQSIAERYGGELTVEIKDHVSIFTMMMNCAIGSDR